MMIDTMEKPDWKPLQFSYDPNTDIMTIEGVQYSGGVFREFGLGPLNRPLKIIKRENGVVHVQVLKPNNA